MERFKPAVTKRWLYFVLGVLWGGVGLFLCLRAYLWLRPSGLKGHLIFVVALFLSFVVGRYGLSRIAFRNLKRLDEKPEKLCCFAFQPWRSYLLVALMIFLGVSLRRSNLPRPLLAFLYAVMGGGLITASFHYFHGGLLRLKNR